MTYMKDMKDTVKNETSAMAYLAESSQAMTEEQQLDFEDEATVRAWCEEKQSYRDMFNEAEMEEALQGMEIEL